MNEKDQVFERSGDMEKQKHTPGPWQIDMERGKYGVVRHNGITVCMLPYPGIRGKDATAKRPFAFTETERLVNARLIAAAPDLLDACRQMFSDIDAGSCLNGSEASCQKARAAIAKATNQETGQ